MNSKALDHFLVATERRAFRIAMIGVKNEETALDIVQLAMMRLAEKYGHHDPTEWPMLFQRILQNAILDHHRRLKVRRAWLSLFSELVPAGQDSESSDYSDTLLIDIADEAHREPEARISQRQVQAELNVAIGDLPLRQQQAFLLRYWEGLDITQTALAMGCSEGSVKTHCSRAMKKLSETLSFLKP